MLNLTHFVVFVFQLGNLVALYLLEGQFLL